MGFFPGRLLLSPVEACVSDLFFGLGLHAPVPAHLSTNALSAPWAFSPSSLLALMSLAVARALLAEGLSQTLLLIVLRQHLFWVHGTMGAKRRRQSRMQFAPSHGRSLRP